MREYMTVAATLPEDGAAGALAGRIWRPDVNGPAIISVREDGVFDITEHAATISALADVENPLSIIHDSKAECIGDLADILANTPEADRDPLQPWLLSPIDLQAVKAAGATFARPMLERFIAEQDNVAPEKAVIIRAELEKQFNGDLSNLLPGSEKTLALKTVLVEQNAWSHDLEVALGEEAEIFTKAQPMSTIGHGMKAGLHPRSTLSNPEPEVALLIAGSGRIVGATLGNDITLRDFTNRSPLLLPKAKDNNASASLGPFIRFFDSFFSLETVRRMEVKLSVLGSDGFKSESSFPMSEMTRTPEKLVRDMMGTIHQYPDGAILYLGSMYAPVQDRNTEGAGFTHKADDIVTISTPALGSLANLMSSADRAEPWVFGTGALMHNLAQRGLLA
ncbi:MAG: fumarylacetoacetate hydrolase family protein [Pseudomonadota bacterium]